jgi:outer membrane protein OmpA-like peptidoglycan-associated protein
VTRSLAPFACVLVLACAAGKAQRQRADSIAAELKAVREQGGETCAPREFAVADANLRFAQLELERGDWRRADAHLATAEPAARDALSKSRDCARVNVFVREKPPGPPSPTVAVKDADGDGVADVNDLCPDVPGPLERRGCPLFTDRDGDGVSDDIDRCPELPGSKENFGCPWPDRDGDRVADRDDRCADEPGPPENQGCPRKTLIVVRRDRIELKQQIHFQPNRAVILSDSHDLLGQVAQAIKDGPQGAVRIEGHTDNVGKRRENLKLSQARADSVKEYLVGEGVDATQLTAVGYGPKRPVASNATRAGRTLNRRVEFRIEEPKK